jgi:mannose-6-phosphate isomerase-like protein (cupin superfamily)
MAPPKVSLAGAFASFDELWSPRVAAEVNDYAVKLAKVEGEFVWHRHDDTDELFLVVNGELTLRFRDGDVVLSAGELLVVPRGVEHCPVADREAHVLLFEPAATVNTGDARSERTRDVQPLET